MCIKVTRLTTCIVYGLWSRFHLLQEFDEEKRSCWRCLVGHNRQWWKTHPNDIMDETCLNDDHGSYSWIINLLKVLARLQSKFLLFSFLLHWRKTKIVVLSPLCNLILRVEFFFWMCCVGRKLILIGNEWCIYSFFLNCTFNHFLVLLRAFIQRVVFYHLCEWGGYESWYNKTFIWLKLLRLGSIGHS